MVNHKRGHVSASALASANLVNVLDSEAANAVGFDFARAFVEINNVFAVKGFNDFRLFVAEKGNKVVFSEEFFHGVCFLGYGRRYARRGEKSRLNFAPVPIFHGSRGDNVTLATVLVTLGECAILDDNKSFARILFLISQPVAIRDAKIKRFRVNVVAVKGTDFELFASDFIVVGHVVVFLVTGIRCHKVENVQLFFVLFLLSECLREITYPGPPGLGISPREEFLYCTVISS